MKQSNLQQHFRGLTQSRLFKRRIRKKTTKEERRKKERKKRGKKKTRRRKERKKEREKKRKEKKERRGKKEETHINSFNTAQEDEDILSSVGASLKKERTFFQLPTLF